MDFEPRPRVLSFQSVQSSNDHDDEAVASTRRTSISSSTSARRVSLGAQASRKASKAGTQPYVSPYRLWRKLSDSIQEKKLGYNEGQTVENTYRTEPKRRFPEREVREIIRNSLEGMFATQTYTAETCGFLTKLLSSRILEQVKSLNIERYKLVCFVNVGSKNDQGLRVASRCLWNAEHDTQVTASVENSTVFAVPFQRKFDLSYRKARTG
ncbi:unnamed protein product [Porites lobata]|uniref:Tctex1 domain-containing protein 2 n=1 Tax=Porites lobata TaxID=104759 RepID=A0ABN8P1U9_9CNID|nr:unnamed protein product [Porites lobata]